MRIHVDQDPFLSANADQPWHRRGLWPCAWIACPTAGEAPFVTAYRLAFSLEAAAVVRAHVSADERYELYLDGEFIGRGSERGSPDLWWYESYELRLAAGEHILVARVWSLGELASFNQMHVHHGFLLAPEAPFTDRLGTGIAPWEARRLDGYRFTAQPLTRWRYPEVEIDGSQYPWGVERGAGEGWQPAVAVESAIGERSGFEFAAHHLLHPATLPPMVNAEHKGGAIRFVGDIQSPDIQSPDIQSPDIQSREAAAMAVRAADCLSAEVGNWAALLAGKGALTIPSHTRRRVLIDLNTYLCAYPEVVVSGGAGSTLRLSWAESLFQAPGGHAAKGQRDEIENKYFVGRGCAFLPDGSDGHTFGTLWWEAGRYVQVLVETGEQALTIERLAFRETRYPLEMESRFHASDPRLTEVVPILVRGMQMCAHETFMDCPYYEELMYAGDTRLELLTTYVMTGDDRLVRKALRTFDASRLPSGLTQARYPSRILQIIAPFALWWVAMIRDYALWRDDRAFVEQLMPGVRATVEAFRRFIGADGLLWAPPGWNFMDWVPEWTEGIPAEGVDGCSGLLNWQLVYVLALVADLEAQLGERELAERGRRQAGELARRAHETFWDEGRGLYADDPARRHFSEHTQCMALLSGLVDPAHRQRIAEGLLGDSDLARATIYFSHYLFEAFREIGRVDVLLDRLSLWFDLKQSGFKTTVESPEPSRSDCHAWGAHPLYHYFATILGIRPASLGFQSVEIRPQLGGLTEASGRLVHPRGEIAVDVRATADGLHGRVSLPPGVAGVLQIGDRRHEFTASYEW